MILMRYGILTVAEEYFEAIDEMPRADILRYRLVGSPEHLIEVEVQSTMIVDLAQSESTIFKNFGKDNQYKIRRAETKDLVVCKLIKSHQITEQLFSSLESDYLELVRTKKITPLNMQRLRLLREQDRLFIGWADTADGTPLAWHVYLVVHGRARLLYSVSLFRETQQSAPPALVGRANRLLHWNDIIEFKKAGIEQYDFGGYYQGNTDESKLRINQFKDEFHGELRTEYNGLRSLSFKGSMALSGLRFYRSLSRFLSPKAPPQP